MNLLSTLLPAVLICTCVACSSSGPDTTAQENSKPESQKVMKRPLSDYEATLDPSQYDEDVEAVVKKTAEQKPPTELQLPKDSTVVLDTTQLGFRIQLYSTASIDEAMNMKTNFEARFPQDSIYIVYDPPVYKVRLGDFPTRYDASIELPTIVNMGYSDAWIVPDTIVRRRVIQVPRGPGQ